MRISCSKSITKVKQESPRIHEFTDDFVLRRGDELLIVGIASFELLRTPLLRKEVLVWSLNLPPKQYIVGNVGNVGILICWSTISSPYPLFASAKNHPA